MSGEKSLESLDRSGMLIYPRLSTRAYILWLLCGNDLEVESKSIECLKLAPCLYWKWSTYFILASVVQGYRKFCLHNHQLLPCHGNTTELLWNNYFFKPLLTLTKVIIMPRLCQSLCAWSRERNASGRQHSRNAIKKRDASATRPALSPKAFYNPMIWAWILQ